MRQTGRGRRSDVARGQTSGSRGGVRTPEVPSLAEIRRRATHRLREIAARLEEVKQEHARAAAECARLQAANGAVAAEPPPAPAMERADCPVPAETPPVDVDPEPEERVGGEEHLAELEGAVERERAAKAELERRLSALASDVERERSAHGVTAEERDRLKAGLRHAERRLAEQARRAETVEARVEQLQAELHVARHAPEPEAEASDDWQQRVLALQLDLRSALEEKAQACGKLESLLRFLDELNEVLGKPAAGPK